LSEQTITTDATLITDTTATDTTLTSAPTVATTDTTSTTSTLSSTTTVKSTSTLTLATSPYDVQNLRSTLGVRSTDKASYAGIAIIDSGIYPSPDLEGRIVAFRDFTSGSVATVAPSDGYGHGTHIAGLIAGSGKLSYGRYMGVALGARLIGLKVLNSQGAGYTSDVIAALDYAVAYKATLGIDVINLSLGHPIYESAATDPLVLAVERAVSSAPIRTPGWLAMEASPLPVMHRRRSRSDRNGRARPRPVSTTSCRRSARGDRRGMTAESSPT
jgi:subtilisin family serine protease